MSTGSYIAAYAAYVAAVHAIEGPWHHWKKGRYVDMWTLTHVAWGVIARRMRVPFGTYMLLAAANEGAEWLVRQRRPDLVWGSPEGNTNVLMDMVANVIGYSLTPATEPLH